uniref:Neuroepithelial cell transforming 1 n=1 Tax=Eptatretus burgeri TaxID=7764 RepID=A0A8C4Q9I0_EPTBU
MNGSIIWHLTSATSLPSQLPCLHAYSTYCSNQVAAKALLDRKKQDPRVGDFLRRCLESPFSRKLELWSFLDVPRSRLVKYPLLLREILRHTPADHSDRLPLEDAVDIVQGVAARVNELTGESECRHYLKRLDFLDERQREPLLANCRVLHCHGELRNNRGTVQLSTFSKLVLLIVVKIDDYPNVLVPIQNIPILSNRNSTCYCSVRFSC